MVWNVLFVVAGLFAWVGAAMQWRRVSRWLEGARAADATIVRLEGAAPGQLVDPSSASPRASAFPVVAFTDGAGERHEVRARMGMRVEALRGRASLPILYDPAHPDDVRFPPHADRNSAVTLAGMGVIVLILGVVGFLR